MLTTLSIRDFVLIERLDVDLSAGFTALTGETGAGKSILLDALGLACGAKADSGLVRAGASRAEITAAFSVAPKSPIAKALGELAIDDANDQILLRRVVEAEGRSRAFINGRPAAIAELRALGELLVDVHAQHEHQSLTRASVQRDLLDAYARASPARAAVASAWQTHQTARRALERAMQDANVIAVEREMLQERSETLSSLAPSGTEWTALSDEQTRLAHAQTLLDAASAAVNALSDQDEAVVASLGSIISKLRAATRFDSALTPHADLLDSALISLEEAAHGLRAYVDKFDLDPDRAREVDARMGALHQAARRFKVPVEQLEGLLAQTAARLRELSQSADLDALQATVTQTHTALAAACEELTRLRQRGGQKLAKAVSDLAKSLALGNARFEIQLAPLAEPAAHGNEDVGFRFASHATLAMQPIEKAASGGELARLSLAIMVTAAQSDGVPTLIFDEVDVGIGGAVAAIVGAHLRELGEKRQVLVVTHQAQVAAHAHQHLAVRKQETKTRRGVALDALDDDARIDELARMISGHETTKATKAHAQELLSAGQTRR